MGAEAARDSFRLRYFSCVVGRRSGFPPLHTDHSRLHFVEVMSVFLVYDVDRFSIRSPKSPSPLGGFGRRNGSGEGQSGDGRAPRRWEVYNGLRHLGGLITVRAALLGLLRRQRTSDGVCRPAFSLGVGSPLARLFKEGETPSCLLQQGDAFRLYTRGHAGHFL